MEHNTLLSYLKYSLDSLKPKSFGAVETETVLANFKNEVRDNVNNAETNLEASEYLKIVALDVYKFIDQIPELELVRNSLKLYRKVSGEELELHAYEIEYQSSNLTSKTARHIAMKKLKILNAIKIDLPELEIYDPPSLDGMCSSPLS